MYEVYLCASSAHMPLSFACHTWFVTNENGVFIRYEVLFQKNINTEKGYFHTSKTGVFNGLGIFIGFKKPTWKGKILGTISGEQGKKIIETIKRSEAEYPHIHKYKLTRPNSNSYTQWILEKFPEWDIRLPWNAFGK